VSAEAAHSGSFGASLGPIGSLGFLNYFEASWRGDVLPASVRINEGPFDWVLAEFTELEGDLSSTHLQFSSDTTLPVGILPTSQ
jgi:hypothetical protein